MAVRIHKPTSAGRRQSSVQRFDDLTPGTKPLKHLRVRRMQKAGRNNRGSITVRHRGGGVKRFTRIVDFRRTKLEIPARVETIEYDPNRGARIARVCYRDGERSYILAPDGLKAGDTVMASHQQTEIKPGYRMPLGFIPAGMMVSDVELEPGAGGKLAHGAGTAIQILALDGNWVQLKLPSGEVRAVSKACMATVGSVSNKDWSLVRWGKAGRLRRKSRRPSVRGKAMNPVDHPHGGGEGNQPIGMKHPKTPWGKPALGVLTRRSQRSDRYILARRKKRTAR